MPEMRGKMNCTECSYFWKDYVEVPMKLDDGSVEYTVEEVGTDAYCHYRWDDGCAPCEV